MIRRWICLLWLSIKTSVRSVWLKNTKSNLKISRNYVRRNFDGRQQMRCVCVQHLYIFIFVIIIWRNIAIKSDFGRNKITTKIVLFDCFHIWKMDQNFCCHTNLQICKCTKLSFDNQNKLPATDVTSSNKYGVWALFTA